MVERSLSVAIALHDPEAAGRLEAMVHQLHFPLKGIAKTGLEALALVQLHKPSLLIMDELMPGLSAREMLTQIQGVQTTAVVFVLDAQHESGFEAMDAGAAGVLITPLYPSQVKTVCEMAVSRFEREQGLRNEIASLKDGLETRKLLDRAKGILMAERGVTEQEAYRLLQKMSQDKRVSIKDVCRAVDQIRLVVGERRPVSRSKNAM